MKKLLTLCLVLAIASLAAAVPSLDFKTEAVVGETITVSLVDDGGLARNISTGVFLQVSSGDYVEGTFDAVPSFFGLSPSIAQVGPGIEVSGPGTYLNTPTLPGNIVFTFDFDTTEVGIITLNVVGLYNNAGASELSGEINVIPEPMTILLLGMGGLFLRRRK